MNPPQRNITATNIVLDYCNRTSKKIKNLKHDDYLRIIAHATSIGVATGLKMAKDTLKDISEQVKEQE